MSHCGVNTAGWFVIRHLTPEWIHGIVGLCFSMNSTISNHNYGEVGEAWIICNHQQGSITSVPSKKLKCYSNQHSYHVLYLFTFSCPIFTTFMRMDFKWCIFDIVDVVSLDDMHSICLGVISKMATKWSIWGGQHWNPITNIQQMIISWIFFLLCLLYSVLQVSNL